MLTKLLASYGVALILLICSNPALAQHTAPEPSPVFPSTVPPFSSKVVAPTRADGKASPRVDAYTARATPARKISLANGMTIILKESTAQDFVGIELLCQVGLQNEETPQSGLIALWQKILQDRLDEATAKSYRVVSKSVSAEPDFLRFSLVGPSAELESMLQALASVINDTSYSDAVVLREKKRLKEEIESGSGPNNQLYSIFRVLFYRFHPYRRQYTSGTLALERINASVISDFHKKYLVANRSVMAIVGRYAVVEVEDDLRQIFAAVKTNVASDLSVAWEAKPAEKHIDLSTRADLGWVLMGYPAPTAGSDDHIPMLLIQMVLSEGLSSRLFNEIRERQGLSYTISSIYPDLKGPSHFLTYIVTKPADTGRVRREILKQVERMRSELLSPSELTYAKEKVRGAFLIENETVEGKAFRLARAESIGLGYLYEENFLLNLDKIRVEEVRRVAKAYLQNPTIIIARPGGRLYFDY